MKTLYIGGTGEISYSCVQAGVAAGHDVTVFNRGRCTEPLPAGVRQIIGDLGDVGPGGAYRSLAAETWDVVCQFRAYDVATVEKDVETFGARAGGKVGQYVFISSASVYSKPLDVPAITEKLPVGNVFWSYSQNKALAEQALLRAHAEKQLPVTIVRPSHTYRRNFPGSAMTGDEIAWRMLRTKAVIIHGDGTAPWTLTHADDFAVPFVRLLGNAKALGETFQVTAHLHGQSWNTIYRTVAEALGAEPKFIRVPTDTIARCKPDVAGSLQGDKMWPSLFDNTKLKGVVGDYESKVSLLQGLRGAAEHVKRRLEKYQPDARVHGLVDKIVAAQQAISGE